MVLVVKNVPGSAGDTSDVSSVCESGKSPGGGHGNSLQYSCLENPMDRGAQWATVQRATKLLYNVVSVSAVQQSEYVHTHTHTHTELLFSC